MATQPQIPRELPLDDKRASSNDLRLVLVFNDYDLVNVLKPWEHLMKTSNKLLLCSVANFGETLQRLQISFLEIADIQSSEGKLVVTSLRKFGELLDANLLSFWRLIELSCGNKWAECDRSGLQSHRLLRFSAFAG